MGMVRDVIGDYNVTGVVSEADVLAAAEEIMRLRLVRGPAIGSPKDLQDFFRFRLGHLDHEEMHVCWLDNRHRVLGVEMLSTGTIDGASVYPREVVKAALRINAAACAFSHNHPSGFAEPSRADSTITKELSSALKLVGVRVLDHIVVTAGECTSFAAQGLL
jgi:DNA repair protein RadC